MIKQVLKLAVVAAFVLTSPALAATVGEKAPEFKAVDTNGDEHALSDFAGKTVVLEWTNHQCPFVIKHYDTGNMQALQKAATEDGVIWLTIVSSAEGKQGHVTPEKANAIVEEAGAHPTAKILDSSGEIGKLYGAQTTPHMFVIDGDGTLAYAGAIDSDSSARHSAVETADNYVTAALESLKNGESVKVASTQPYGCSVKY